MQSQYLPASDPTDFSLMSEGRVVELLLEMVEKCLAVFPQHLRAIEDYDEMASELFFNSEFSHTFQTVVQKSGFHGCTFHDESASLEHLMGIKKKKGIPPRVDLGIRLVHKRDRIMLVEGKRLHNPSDKQYVSGDTGGIARFKQEQHGADVEVACMVGYVQTNTFAFWHEKVNAWIRGEAAPAAVPNWDESDCLNPLIVKADHLTQCLSQHRRINKEPIGLHHFWVRVI